MLSRYSKKELLEECSFSVSFVFGRISKARGFLEALQFFPKSAKSDLVTRLPFKSNKCVQLLKLPYNLK